VAPREKNCFRGLGRESGVSATGIASVSGEDVDVSAENGRLTVRLPNGTLGHFHTRPDNCMAAAVATILNCTTIDEVPDAPDARIAAGESQ
jgi:hypothetical protein